MPSLLSIDHFIALACFAAELFWRLDFYTRAHRIALSPRRSCILCGLSVPKDRQCLPGQGLRTAAAQAAASPLMDAQKTEDIDDIIEEVQSTRQGRFSYVWEQPASEHCYCRPAALALPTCFNTCFNRNYFE
jgi:hypothetical protein